MDSGIPVDDRFRLGAHSRRSREGEVHEAFDEQTSKACEIEVVFASGFRVEEIEERLQREVEIGARLEGPGFLRALGTGRLENGRLFVARQRGADTRPLLLSSGDLEQRVWRVLSAARRVEELAGQGGVHRDLGPLTLLEDAGDEVLLTGFALTKLDGVDEPPLDQRGLPVTWLPCSSPELLRAPDEVDARSDVYALGTLLFMALAGRWPYPGPTLFDLFTQQEAVRSGGSPPPLPQRIDPDVPDGLGVICAKALALDPQDRTGSASEFAEQLEDYLAVRASGVFSPLPLRKDPSDRLPVAVPVEAKDEVDASARPFFPTGRTVPSQPAPAPPEGVSLIPELVQHSEPKPGTVTPGGAWGNPARRPPGKQTAALKVELPPELEPEEVDDEITEPIDVEMPPGESDRLASLEEIETSATGTEVFEVVTVESDDDDDDDDVESDDDDDDDVGDEDDDVGETTASMDVELPPGESGLQRVSTSAAQLLQEALASDSASLMSAPTERLPAVTEEDLAEADADDDDDDDEDGAEELSPEEAAAMFSAKVEPARPAPASLAEVLTSEALFDPFASDEHPALPLEPSAEDDEPDAEEQPGQVAVGPPAPPPSLPDLPPPPAIERREPAQAEVFSEAIASDSDLELDPLLDSGDRTRVGHSESAAPAVTQNLGALDLTDLTAADPPTGFAPAPPPTTTAPPPAPSALPELPEEEEEEIELLLPVAFEDLHAHDGGVLVFTMPKDFEAAVADVRRLNADGFDHLILDMQGVAFLGGSQLEALTELVSLAARRDLETVMFGLKPDLRQLLKIMDMDDVLPAALAAVEVEDAVREAVRRANAQ